MRLFIIVLLVTGCRSKKAEVTGIVKENRRPVKHKGENPKPPVNTGVSGWQEKIGISGKQVRDNKLYTFIDDWYGAPYQYGGCQKTGVDCSCFTSILCEHVYGKRLSRTAGDMFKECDLITADNAKEGDLFFFRMNGKTITHVGVCVKENFFVHSSTSKGVMINNLGEAYYKKYFFCAGRIKSN
jgi:murein DD-endopeptidase / murein LD-carboxypeptidase